MVGPVAIVKQGWLRGTVEENEVGESFISFKGIPYAEPPIGDLRFRDPQPLQPWTGVRKALKEGSQCIQIDSFSNEIEGDEDCLYLNVATKSLKGSRPVMFWIHGGGFMSGNGGYDFYGPHYLVNMDVVVVGINYRLGVFGFLSLDHEIAPGNMGLKDQVAALKWVKENIAQFGGDPNNVTIFGESAGGASVHYHLLSPLSKGLFHKAIAQSGVALNPWAQSFKTVEIACRLAAHLGKETTDPYEVVEYLRTIPAGKLVDAQQNTWTPEEKAAVIFPFAPTIDIKSKEPFLPRSRHELFAESNDVPLLIGYNSHEGSVTISGGFPKEIDEKFHSLFSNCFHEVPLSKIPDIVKEIRKFYFGDKKITKDLTDEFIQCLGDAQVVNGTHKLVELRAKTKSPTYLYRFFHIAPNMLSKIVMNLEFEGTGHFDEVTYLFHHTRLAHVPWIEPGSIEQVISKRFLRMWTDFAKTGNPTPHIDDLITAEWKAVTNTTKNYLAIGAELCAGVNPSEEAMQFWKRLLSAFENYY